MVTPSVAGDRSRRPVDRVDPGAFPLDPEGPYLDDYDFEFLAVNLVAWFAIHDAARRMREARHLGLSPLAYIPFHQVAAMLEVPSADLNAYKGGRRYLRTEHLLQFMGQHRFGEQLFEYAASRNLLYKSAAFSWGGEFGAFEQIEESRKVFLREVKTMKIEHQEEQLRRLSSSIRDLVRLAVDVEGEVVRAGGRAPRSTSPRSNEPCPARLESAQRRAFETTGPSGRRC
jgi:hypothetical protein